MLNTATTPLSQNAKYFCNNQKNDLKSERYEKRHKSAIIIKIYALLICLTRQLLFYEEKLHTYSTGKHDYTTCKQYRCCFHSKMLFLSL